MKKIKNNLIFFVVLLLIGLATPCLAGQTSDNATYFTPQVSIPGSGLQKKEKVEIKSGLTTIAEYIGSIYNYLLAIVGLLATIVLMAAGVIWMTAGGNTERISSAKGWITGALTGLSLLLLSYIILRTINPNLVDFRDPGFDKIGEIILMPDFEIKEDEMDQDTTGRDAYNPYSDPIMQDIKECEDRGENYHLNLTNGQCEEWDNNSNPQECPCPAGQSACMIDEVYYNCEEEVCPCPEGQSLCEIDNILYDCADFE